MALDVHEGRTQTLPGHRMPKTDGRNNSAKYSNWTDDFVANYRVRLEDARCHGGLQSSKQEEKGKAQYRVAQGSSIQPLRERNFQIFNLPPIFRALQSEL